MEKRESRKTGKIEEAPAFPRQEFDRMTADLGRTYEGVDPAVAETEIAEAVAEVRRERGTAGPKTTP